LKLISFEKSFSNDFRGVSDEVVTKNFPQLLESACIHQDDLIQTRDSTPATAVFPSSISVSPNVLFATSLAEVGKPMPIAIFVADRNVMSSQLLAESLARDSRFKVAAVAPAPNILSLPTPSKPAVAVISAELDSGPTKGMHLARTLHARNRDLSIVILLESLERGKVIASFRSGARGVFCRTEPVAELHTCIENVSQGRIWTGRVEAEYLLEAIQTAPNCDGFGELRGITRREAEVAELAAQGLNNKQIAQRLGLSEHTVKNHLFRIFEKLNVANRIELLFLMVKGRDSEHGELAIRLLSEESPRPSEVVSAAEQGFVQAQLMLGLAYLEGSGIKRDDHAAYYWLRLAELNCSHILEHTRWRTAELMSRLPSRDIQELERELAKKQEEQPISKKASKSLRSEIVAITRAS